MPMLKGKIIFNGKRQWLLPLGIVMLIGFCAFFNFAIDNIYDTLLQEKIIEKRLNVDLICDQVDQFIALDNDWDSYDYETIISYVVSRLDTIYGTYAEVYDKNMQSISARSPTYENAPFKPEEYPDFLLAATTNERGNMVLRFEPNGNDPRDMYIYYRWVPTDSTLDNRMLIVVGVSKYSVNSDIANWVKYGAVALIIICAAYIISTTMMYSQLGYIYAQRRGRDKWRPKEYKGE